MQKMRHTEFLEVMEARGKSGMFDSDVHVYTEMWLDPFLLSTPYNNIKLR
jgi:hypothetical protein